MALGWTCEGNQKTYLWNPIWVALLNEMSSTGVEIHVDCRYSRISKSDSACTTVYWGVSIVFSAARTPTAATRAKTNTKKYALEAISTRNLQNLPAHRNNQPNSCHQHINIDIIISTTCQPQSITPKLAGHIGRNQVYKDKNKREICNRELLRLRRIEIHSKVADSPNVRSSDHQCLTSNEFREPYPGIDVTGARIWITV